jgi:hypothetical protein
MVNMMYSLSAVFAGSTVVIHRLRPIQGFPLQSPGGWLYQPAGSQQTPKWTTGAFTTFSKCRGEELLAAPVRDIVYAQSSS